MKIKLFTIYFLLMALSLVSYDEKVHSKISGQSLDTSSQIKNFNNALLISPYFKIIDNSYMDWVDKGTIEEDGWRGKHTFGYDPFGQPNEDIRRSFNHFYDPVHFIPLRDPCVTFDWFNLPDPVQAHFWAMNGSSQLENIYDWEHTKEYLYLALTSSYSYLRKVNLKKFYLSLGHMIHMVQDMAVPAHVRNDNHGINFYPWSTSRAQAFEKERYEAYCSTNFKNLDYEPNGTYQFDDFYDYWSNSNQTGLAEFTNHNFISQDTNFDHFHFDCRQDNLFLAPLWENIYDDLNDEEVAHVVRYYLHTIHDLYTDQIYPDVPISALSYWDFFLEEYGPQVLSMNSTIYLSNALILLPHATAYSAGLLDHIFQPQIDAKVKLEPADGLITAQITNISDIDFGPGDIHITTFPHDSNSNWEPQWLENPGSSVLFNGAESLHISGLQAGQTLDIPHIFLNLTENYSSTIQILFFFNGEIQGDDNRTVAKVITVDVEMPEVHFNEIKMADWDYELDSAPSYSGYCFCDLNNYGYCTGHWHALGCWTSSHRRLFSQTMEADIVTMRPDKISEIRLLPNLPSTDQYELFVNGSSVGKRWSKFEHPNEIPETLSIRMNYYPLSSSTGHPQLLINGNQMITVPYVLVDHEWTIYDRVTGHEQDPPKCPFEINAIPFVMGDFSVMGSGLVMANGQEAENGSVTIEHEELYNQGFPFCLEDVDCEFMRNLVYALYSPMSASYISYGETYGDMRPHGLIEDLYSEEELNFAESRGRLLEPYGVPFHYVEEQ